MFFFYSLINSMSTFVTVRIHISFCYIKGRKFRVLYVYLFPTCLLFSLTGTFVNLFPSENVLFCDSIQRKFRVLHVYLSHAKVNCLPFSRRECFILLHHVEQLYFFSSWGSCLLFHELVPCLSFSRLKYLVLLYNIGRKFGFLMSTSFTTVYSFHGLFHSEK